MNPLPHLRHLCLGLLASALLVGAWVFPLRQQRTAPPITPPFECLSYDPSFHIPHFDPKSNATVPPDLIAHDLDFLQQFTPCIRIYTTMRGLDALPALAAERRLSVILGVWLDGEYPDRSQADLDRAIQLAQQHPDTITKVIIGNEVLLFDTLEIDDLLTTLREAKSQFTQPLSYADVPSEWIAHPQLFTVVDYVTLHSFPYWDGVPPTQAVNALLKQKQNLEEFSGLPVFLGEVGWPSEGFSRGVATATGVGQGEFLRNFLTEAHRLDIRYNLIEAFDQPWKLFSQEGRTGAHWGLFTHTHLPKFPFTGPLSPQSPLPLSVVITLSLLTFLWGLWWARPLHCHGQLFVHLTLQSLLYVALTLTHTLVTEYMLQSWLVWVWVIPPQLFLSVVYLGLVRDASHIIGDYVLQRPTPPPTDQPAESALPFVSIHVPCRDEPPQQVIATLTALSQLDYPHFEVLALDNNSTRPHHWAEVTTACAALPHVQCHQVASIEGFKAGALNHLLTLTDPRAQLIAVVDADYVVAPQWLSLAVPHFHDSATAVVQCPQRHLFATDDTFQTTLHDELNLFFELGMVQRDAPNSLIQHGTMTLIRRSTLHAVGDWATWCLCEDADLGLRLQSAGHQVIYLHQSLGHGLLPATPTAYESQRARWAYGAVTILQRHWRTFFGWRSPLSLRQRADYVLGWLPWLGDALFPIFAVLGLIGVLIAHINVRYLPPVQLFYGLLLFWVVRTVAGLLTTRRRTALPWPRLLRAQVSAASLTYAIAHGVFLALSRQPYVFHVTQKGHSTHSTQPTPPTAPLWQRIDLQIGLTTLTLSALLLLRYGPAHLEVRTWCLGVIVLCLPMLASLWLAKIDKLKYEN